MRTVIGRLAAVAALASSSLLATAAPSSAAPQPITFAVVGGSIDIGEGEDAFPPIEFPQGTGLTGTLDDESGALDVTLLVPEIQIDYELSPGAPIPLVITITQVGPGNGSIDPDTGDAELDITLDVGIGSPVLGEALGPDCSVGPIPIQFSSSDPGAPFDGDAGTLALAAAGFTIPAASDCGSFDAIISDGLGLPRSDTAALVQLQEGEIPTPPPTTTTTTTAPTAPPTTAPVAPPPPPPAAPPSAGSHLPGASISPLYTCAGADAATDALLDLLGDEPLAFSPRVSVGAISPSPEQGASFTASFTGQLSLAADLVSSIMAVGITEATVSNLSVPVRPNAGVSGEPVVMAPPARTFTLVSGQPLSFTIGPFDGTFTRTSAIGQPVAWEVGELAVTLTGSLGGSPIEVNLLCSPSGTTVLSMLDGSGSAPAGGVLPRTGSSDALLAGGAMSLLLLGGTLILGQRRLRRRSAAHLA